MSDRPRIISEGIEPKAITPLIRSFEDLTESMTDEELEQALEELSKESARCWGAIVAARSAYQLPSRKFLTFDRILKKRRLMAANPDVPFD